MSEDWRSDYERRLLTPEDAANLIQPGDAVYTPIGGDAETLLRTLLPRLIEDPEAFKVRACSPRGAQEWFGEDFDWLTADVGVDLSYWTLPPVRARRDRAAVLEVHGGPHTNYVYGFAFEFHLLSAEGYTVVYGNPRGGSSFGPEFYQAVLSDYGGGDARDVLAIAEHAMERHRDPRAPLHLTGGSYGGFMTNWLVTQTDRFASAVTQRSICNWLSFYGASDIGYRFTEREQGGRPWEDTEGLWEQSPLKHVGSVRTPVLVMHSEQDHRCPMEQAEQWFTALKRLGRAEVEFLRFPDEGHELSRSGRPDRRLARLGALLDWFDRHG